MTRTKAISTGPSFDVGLGWALATLLRDYQKQVEAALDGLPGGARGFLVMSLVDKETCHSQVAIAERLTLDKTTLTYLLDDLEKADLIRRMTDPNDRRSRHINLTPEGSRALARFTRAVHQVEDNILARLGPEGAAQFQSSLLAIAGLANTSMAELESSEDSSHICEASIGLDQA